jgi:hypothetical protein
MPIGGSSGGRCRRYLRLAGKIIAILSIAFMALLVAVCPHEVAAAFDMAKMVPLLINTAYSLIMLTLLQSVSTPWRFDDPDLPGSRPSPVSGYLSVLPLPVVMTYVFIMHTNVGLLHSVWFTYAPVLTHPFVALIPSIARTVRELDAAGLTDRATEIGHYLGLMWMLCAAGVVAGLVWEQLTWTEANYVWEAAAFRRRWERQSRFRRFIASACAPLLPVILAGTLFWGHAASTGRYAYDLAGGTIDVVTGILWSGSQSFLFCFVVMSMVHMLIRWQHGNGHARPGG